MIGTELTVQSRPLKTINVHDHLRSKLCDLYENDCIFDKFECTFSGNGECVVHGSGAALTRQARPDRVVQQLLPHLRPRGVDRRRAASGQVGV